MVITFCSQNSLEINIEVIAEGLPERTKIYITENDEQFDNWQPDEIELDIIENGKWSKSFSFQKGKSLL